MPPDPLAATQVAAWDLLRKLALCMAFAHLRFAARDNVLACVVLEWDGSRLVRGNYRRAGARRTYWRSSTRRAGR